MVTEVDQWDVQGMGREKQVRVAYKVHSHFFFVFLQLKENTLDAKEY